MVAALAALALALLAPGEAGATVDAGSGYRVLRLSDAGLFLVATCDIQGEAPPRLAILDARGREKERPAGDSSVPEWCGWPQVAQAAIAADRVLSERLNALGLDKAPTTGPWSPSRTRYVLVGQHAYGAELQIVEPRGVVKKEPIKAQPGFSPFTVEVTVGWHPDERWVVVAGSRVRRVVPGVAEWVPVFVAWERPGPLSVKPYIVDAWEAWGRRQLKRCRHRKSECNGAEDAFRRALQAVPDYPPAVEGLEAVETMRK